MLTPEEYTAAQAALSAADTEKAALEQQRRDCIEKAREYNAQTKACTNRITAIDTATAGTKAQVAECVAEQKRQQAEKIKAERAAQEKAAAEAKAKEKSAVERLLEANAALKEQLAAKG